MNFLFLIVLIIFGSVKAQEEECQIPGYDFNGLPSLSANDDDTGNVVWESKYVGDLVLDSNYTYLDIELNSTDKTISLIGKDLDSFDKDTSYCDLQFRETATFNIQCSTYTQLIFDFTVNDVNSNPPEFSKSTYDYKVGMPAIKGVEITNYGDQMIITDKDFSNKDIQLKVEPDDFIVSVNKDCKSYKASIRTKNVLKLTEDTTYTITATDDGGLTAESTFTIIIDPDNVIPDPPTFDAPSYEYKYAVDDQGACSITGQDIKITTTESNFTITLTPDDYISCNKTDSENIIECTCVEIIPLSDNPTYKTYTINVTTDSGNTAQTTLILSLPAADSDSIPEYNNTNYIATYDKESNSLILESDIGFNNVVKIQKITIEETYKAYFEVTIGEKIEIKITGTIPDDIIQKGQIVVTLTAVVEGGGSSDSLLIIIFPQSNNADSIFEDKSYVATYNEETKKLEMDTKISIKSDVTVKTIIVKDYEEKLKISCEDNKCIVELIDSNDDIIKKGTIVTSVQATTDDNLTGEATLVIKFPQSDSIFDDKSYVATYNEETKKLEMDTKISIKSDVTVKTIIVKDYEEKLKISCEDKKCIVELIDSNDDIIKKGTIVTSIQATTDDNLTGEATLIIIFPQSNNADLIFDDMSYVATYNEETKKLEMDTKISIKSDVTIKAIIVKDYEEKLKISCEDKKCIVELIDSNDDIIKKGTIVTSVQASTDDNLTGEAALIIIFPQSNNADLIFDDMSYVATYNEKTKKLEMDTKISIKSDVTIKTIIVKDYEKKLKISCQDKKCLVELIDSNDDIIKKGTIVTSVQATTDDNLTGEATLVIKFPQSDDNNDDDNDDDNNKKVSGYIAAVSVLAILLVCVAVIAGLLYFCKIRPLITNRKDEEDTERNIEEKPTRFETQEKHFSQAKQEQNQGPVIRRPTGFVFIPPPPEEDDDEETQNEETLGESKDKSVEETQHIPIQDDSDENNADESKEKSVVFNEMVEEMQYEPTQDNSDDENPENNDDETEHHYDEVEENKYENTK